jgi:hypothetical protein
MIKLALALVIMSVTVASAQDMPGWRIVLKNFLGQNQAILPQPYMSKNECDLARVQMGYQEFNPLGVHGVCKWVPVIYGRRHKH